MNSDIAKLHERKLAELAKDPRNIVYHYVDREPVVKEPVPIAHVRGTVAALWEFIRECKQKNAAMRRQIACEHDERFKMFSETHPDMFDRVVHPDTTQQNINTVFHTIDLFERQSRGAVFDGRALLSKHLLDTYGVPVDKYKAQNPDVKVHTLPRA